MNRSAAAWVRLGIAGMVVSFVANMVAADPLPDPVAIVCLVAFAASFVVLAAGSVRAIRDRRMAS